MGTFNAVLEEEVEETMIMKQVNMVIIGIDSLMEEFVKVIRMRERLGNTRLFRD